MKTRKDRKDPISEIDPHHPQALDDIRAVVAAMVVRTGQEKDPHFLDMAETFLTGVTAFVLWYSEEKSFAQVRAILSDATKLKQAIGLMKRSGDAYEGSLALLGGQLEQPQAEELGSILSSVNRVCAVFDTPAVRKATTGSTFNMADLYKRRMTLYVVLPADKVVSHRAFLRLMVDAAVRAGFRNGPQEHRLLNLVVDEAASVGKLDSLMAALYLGRGYGLRVSQYIQTISQLHEVWGEAGMHTILSNSTQTYFAVNDWQTAEHIANRGGDFTQVLEGGSETDNYEPHPGGWPYTPKSRSTNASWSLGGRKLWQASEVLKWDRRLAVTFHPGVPPIRSCNVAFFDHTPPRTTGLLWAALQVAVIAGAVAVLAAGAVREVLKGGLPWAP